MSLPELVVEHCACDVRGPFQLARQDAACECILCAVDHAALPRFGAFAPLRRLSRRRSEQVADVGLWLLSLGAQSVIVLQPPTTTSSYLTSILDFMQLQAPLALHRLSLSNAIASGVPDQAMLQTAARLRRQCAGASLLRRLHCLNRLAGSSGSGNGLTQSRLPSITLAVLRVASAARRTLVLGDWLDLRVLQRGLGDMAMREPVETAAACVTLA